MNAKTRISTARVDDAMEPRLTPEQPVDLSQAEKVEEPIISARIPAIARSGRMASAHSSPPPLFKVSPSGRFHRLRRTPTAKMTGAVVAYAAFAWWGASQLAGEPQVPAVAAAATPAPIIPRPVLAPGAASPVVRVVNPFDATEVFEFPAGTSDAQGREKVAQMLLERARERQSRWEHIRPMASLHNSRLRGQFIN